MRSFHPQPKSGTPHGLTLHPQLFRIQLRNNVLAEVHLFCDHLAEGFAVFEVDDHARIFMGFLDFRIFHGLLERIFVELDHIVRGALRSDEGTRGAVPLL